MTWTRVERYHRDNGGNGWRSYEAGTFVADKPKPPTRPGLGLYAGGGANELTTANAYFAGARPDLANTYYQTAQIYDFTNDQPAAGNPMISVEKARLDAGITPVITWTLKDNASALLDMANQTGQGWTALQAYVDALRTTYAYATTKGLGLYATLDHEFEVKVNQGTITAVTRTQYAAALSSFIDLCRTQAPGVATLYWYGRADQANIDLIGSSLTQRPDMITFDPYASQAHPATETFTSLVQPNLDWLVGRSWYDAQPIALTEFGCNHENQPNPDALEAAFYTNLRGQMRALGLTFANYFDRTDSTIVNTITDGAHPLACAAFTASLTQE